VLTPVLLCSVLLPADKLCCDGQDVPASFGGGGVRFTAKGPPVHSIPTKIPAVDP